MCWRGKLGISMGEFWLLQPGLFDDMVAAWRILHGEKAAPTADTATDNDDNIFNLT